MTATNNARSNRQARQKLGRQSTGAIKTYLNGNSFEQKSEALNQIISRSSGLFDHLKISKALIELATLAPDHKKATYVERGVAKAMQAQQEAVNPATKIETALFIANLPVIVSTHVDKTHPSVVQLEKAQRSLAIVLIGCGLSDVHPEKVREVVGFSAEASALLLLQRFATQSVQTGDYTPIPALYSQDHTAHKTTHNRQSWDISVFTQPEIEEPNYRLQIKYRTRDESYADSITGIAMTELVDGRTIRLGELVRAATLPVLGQADRFIQNQANLFTDALLDKMG